VSLLSPERLTLWIGPDAVQAVHSRGWRGQLKAAYTEAVHDPSPALMGARLDLCRALVARCKPDLLRVVVSDQLLRYRTLGWHPGLRNREEERALAVLDMEAVYGETMATEWSVSVALAPPGCQRLVCAMPLELRTGLQEIAASHRARLASVRPAAVAALEAQRAALPTAGWFVHAEGRRLTVLQFAAGAYPWVSSVRSASAALPDLRRAIAGQMALAGAPALTSGVFLSQPHVGVSVLHPAEAALPAVQVLGMRPDVLRTVLRAPHGVLAEAQALGTFGFVLMGAAL